MIQFNSISMKNFWAVGNKEQSIPLDGNKSYLIVGDNHDIGDRGYSRNGVGKSSVFLAIQYALFGETIESIRADGYINLKNKKKMQVTLDLHVGEDHYQIVRGRKPTFCQLFKNGNDISRDTIDNTTKFIENVLGFDLDIFKNTFLFDPSIQPFMALKPASQRDFIERLVNLDVITERAEQLKEKRKELKTDLQLLDKEKEMIESQRQTIQQRINDLVQSKEQDKEVFEKNKRDLEEKMEEVSSIDIEKEKSRAKEKDGLISETKDLQQQIDDLNRQFKDLQQSKSCLSEIHQELEKLKTRKEFSEEERKQLEGQYEELLKVVQQNEDQKDKIKQLKETERQREQEEKRHSDKKKERAKIEEDLKLKKEEIRYLESSTCPYCQQTYHDQEKLTEARNAAESLDGDLSSTGALLEEISSSVQSLRSSEDDLKSQITVSEDEINQKERELDRVKQKLDGFDSSYIDERINELNQKLEKELTVEEYDNKIWQTELSIQEITEKKDGINKKIEEEFSDVFTMEECYELENYINSLREQYNNQTSNEEFYNQQIANAEKELEGTVFDQEKYDHLQRKYEHIEMLIKLLTDNKSFIRRSIVDQYVPFLNQKINEYKDQLGLPHNVEINNDLSVEIEYLGESVQYGNMSNGQRLRLNLATSLAFNQLCSVLGKRTNIIFVDEYLDSSLDQQGVLKAFDFLKSFTDNVFIISHRDEFVPYVDGKLLVTLKNGYTGFELFD